MYCVVILKVCIEREKRERKKREINSVYREKRDRYGECA